ncbi:uncharacterized protein EAE98_010164 [Botrytis deweyae]|uniref:F-box domain-containing protein n=2 Tax=Botrytis TaxID=33196 RepID=A0A4Z1IUL0_9HELO|nr:uncharacterized protein EAE98_010164 [Botrytis deweyae]KAF7917401.1 hypothetical protein EAE98_010164 [Botrytis deweyae]KAF7920486.1 hypothetical protein EAE99_008100 [Botrytis elliptica]TGO65159.1 hypothetical protein BELL_1019g00020 [Botrytis elliptica]
MSVPPISSLASSDTDIDLEAAFKESLGIARDVVKGVLLKSLRVSFEGHNISFPAQQILSGDETYNTLLTMRDLESPTGMMIDNNVIQLPYSGNIISSTSQSSAMSGQMNQMAFSPLTASNLNSHIRPGNSIQQQPFNNSNYRPQSSFNVTQSQTELPQLANLLRAVNTNNYSQQQTYPSSNNSYSLSSNQPLRPQPQQQNPATKYPQNMDDLFSRSDSVLASQIPANRSNFQQQMIARLQKDSRTFANQSYSSYGGQGGQGPIPNLERSSSSSSVLSSSSLPTLAPAQKLPQTENLLVVESRSSTQSRSETPMDLEMTKATNPRKRKVQTEEQKAAAKKARLLKVAGKAENAEKTNKLEVVKKKDLEIPADVVIRILEFCPPIFLRKARTICRSWCNWVRDLKSIHINCRRENYGYNLPDEIPGLSAMQYVDLLGGKGCMEPGCKNKDASRTHWAWKKRWCLNCWKGKIEREDRIQKHRQHRYSLPVIDRLLACIPVSMYDSFGKPHDYVEEGDPGAIQTSTHRLYKYYLIADVENIIKEYEALTPDPYREDPTHNDAQKATARQIWEEKMEKLEEDRDAFFEAKKAENAKIMQLVLQIEAAVREKRAKGRKPNDANRESRRILFLTFAKRDLPDIPEDFIINTKPFKAAVRIFRDGGSERGWRALKPKIQEVYQQEQSRKNDQQAIVPAKDVPIRGNLDEDFQMTGQDLENFEQSNDALRQIGNQGLQQNTQQSQLERYQIPTPITSNRSSLAMIHAGSFDSGKGAVATALRPLNNSTMTFPGGLPLPNDSLLNTSHNNNGSSVSSLSNISHNNGFSTSSFARLSGINNGSLMGSTSVPSRSNNGFPASSMNSLTQNHNSMISSNPAYGNNGLPASTMSILSQNNNNMGSSSTPSRNTSMTPLPQNGNNSFMGSSNSGSYSANNNLANSMASRSQNMNNSSMGLLSNNSRNTQNNNGDFMKSASYSNNNFAANSMASRSQNMNGANVSSPEDFFKMNPYTNPNQMSQSNNVSSVNPPSDFSGHSNYNNAINSGSSNHLTQCNNVSSLLPPPHLGYPSQNNGAPVNSSNQVYQNNGTSSNTSNPGSSSTSRSAMAISSIITGTQPQGN